jgi:probable LLM family oxidoreductase
MEIGLYTFGDVGTDPVTGRQVGPAERLRNLVEEITLADQVGLDVFGLGEHHRPDYAASAPAVALAAAAMQTSRIRLTSAVTVLSSDDPIRVFQQFATLDNLSQGRAEIMAGRGSFIESFPLFGYDLDDYDALFSEKLQLLLQLNEGERITWPGGRHTPRIENRGVYPRPYREKLPVWIAVGGTPQSVARAGVLNLPLALAIIGGEPARFAPLFDLYRQAAQRAGHDPAGLKTSINVHGFVAETSQGAADTFYAPQAEVMNRIGRERGWPPTSRAQFDAARGPRGALFVGSAAEVADKILAAHEIFQFDRFLIQMAIGVLDHAKLMKAIETLGTKVAPEVRKAVADRGVPDRSAPGDA